MEITYIGHSCFKIKGKEVTLIIDPYSEKIGYKLPKLECDILLCTHDHFDHHNVEGISKYSLLIDGPGEYEKQDVLIYGKQTDHDEKEGVERGKNTIYVIDIDGINIMHLGDLGHPLSKEALEKVSDADILMIPVGGTYTLNAKTAAEVISDIEPNIVIPMHYKTKDLVGMDDLDDIDKFLDEMGVEDNVKRQDKLKINSKSDLPEDTEVVILTPNH